MNLPSVTVADPDTVRVVHYHPTGVLVDGRQIWIRGGPIELRDLLASPALAAHTLELGPLEDAQ